LQLPKKSPFELESPPSPLSYRRRASGARRGEKTWIFLSPVYLDRVPAQITQLRGKVMSHQGTRTHPAQVVVFQSMRSQQGPCLQTHSCVGPRLAVAHYLYSLLMQHCVCLQYSHNFYLLSPSDLVHTIHSACEMDVVASVAWLNTVEPLYNGHFGTSHFWVIFAVI